MRNYEEDRYFIKPDWLNFLTTNSFADVSIVTFEVQSTYLNPAGKVIHTPGVATTFTADYAITKLGESYNTVVLYLCILSNGVETILAQTTMFAGNWPASNYFASTLTGTIPATVTSGKVYFRGRIYDGSNPGAILNSNIEYNLSSNPTGTPGGGGPPTTGNYFYVLLYEDNQGYITCGSFATNPFYKYSHQVTYTGLQNFRDFRDGDNSIIDNQARSATITASFGTRFWFYRNPDGPLADGFCEVVIKQNVAGYFLDSFERNYDDAYISVRYYNSQDLDGSISSMGTAYAPIF